MNPSEPDPKTRGGDSPPVPVPDPVEQVPAKKKPRFGLAVRCVIYLGIIGVLVAMAIPNFVKARTTACMNACVANLKQIDGATQQWAVEYKRTTNDVPDWEKVLTYLKGSLLPICPSGGTYHLGETVGASPTCSIGTTHTVR
jgi:competence protein ComGC